MGKKSSEIKSSEIKSIYSLNFLLPWVQLLSVIFGNLFTLKYLHDVYQNEQCVTLNSPYLSFYYRYYEFIMLMVGLFIFVMFILSVTGRVMIHESLFSRPRVVPYEIYAKEKSTKKQSGGVGVDGRGPLVPILKITPIIFSAFLVKLLHDIGDEETCKDIDPTLRETLFYYHILSLLYGLYNFF